jgi:predicted HAD superfamily Cof-like phosphohydrolase
MPFHLVPDFQREVLKKTIDEKGLLSISDLELLCRQLREEIYEFEDAHANVDYIGAIDGLMDLIYFAVGGLHRLGLSDTEMTRCFEAVHLANMTKKKGSMVRDGIESNDDAQKSFDWVSPEERIAEIIGG